MRIIKLSRRFSNPVPVEGHGTAREAQRKVKLISDYMSRHSRSYYDSISEINDLLDRAAAHAGLKMVDYVTTAVPYERSVSLLLATSHPDVFVHVSIYRSHTGRYELVSYPTRSSRQRKGFQRMRNPEEEEVSSVEVSDFGVEVEDLPESYEEAEQVYETFHGTGSKEQVEVEEAYRFRENLAALGTLQEIVLITQSKAEYSISFENDPPLLCSTADSEQLYIIGGDQTLDDDDLLEILDGDEDAVRKDSVWLGLIKNLVYRTQKDFDQFETIDYEHELGEDGGLGAVLIYDRLNSTLMISGGSYKIKREGIVN